MAQERGYEQQTGPRAGAAMPLADAQQFGAGVGGAVAQLGGQLHEQQVRAFQVEKQIAADRQTSDWSHRFAAKRTAMDDQTRALRTDAAPGGDGHIEAVGKAWDSDKDAMFAGIDDPGVRRMAEQQWDSYGGSLHGQEADWQEGQRVGKTVTDQQAAIELGTNRIRTMSDPKAYAQELGIQLQNNAALHIDAATKAKLDKFTEQSFGLAFLQHAQDTNPQLAKALVETGEFDFLDPQTLEQVRNGTEVEIRLQAAAQEHQLAVAKAAGNDQVQTIKTLYGQGVEVPDGDFAAAITFKRSIGDESGAVELEGMRGDNQFAKVYKGQTPRQRELRLGELKAKDKTSPAEQREVKWLEDNKGTLDGQFNSDPVAFAIDNAPRGTKPPPGDVLGDPGAMAGRVQWARSNGPAYGRSAMPVFTKVEAGTLAQRKGDGSGGEGEVLGVLDTILDEPMRIAAAKQIDPDDAVFQHLVVLNPRIRATVRAGGQVLGANQGYFNFGADRKREVDNVKMWENGVRYAMRSMQPADIEATVTIGRQFTAGYFSGRGIAPDDNAAVWQTSTRVALGGGKASSGKMVGGIAYWGDHTYLLPTNHDAQSFAGALLADSQKRKVHPVNPDGSFADVKFAIPTFIGIDPKDPQVWLYGFETRAGRPILGSGGGEYVARIRDK